MRSTETAQRRIRVMILGATACLAMTAPVRAGGGNVLPATARPKGYSLAEAAAVTAYFNTGPRTPDTLPDDFPFQILYVAPGAPTNTFHVKTGTMFYVPVYSTGCVFQGVQRQEEVRKGGK